MADFVRAHAVPATGLAVGVFLMLLAVVLATCAPVNAPAPVTVKQQFRADMAKFCLRNPEAIGCETFSKGVQP